MLARVWIILLVLICSLNEDHKSILKEIYSSAKCNNDSLILKNDSKSQSLDNDFFSKQNTPSLVALFTLFVTNLVILLKIRLDTKAGIKKEITLSKIKINKEKLEKFYTPLYTILASNENIFENFGPKSFPENPHMLNEVSELWNNMVLDLIIPNNDFIMKIIRDNSYLKHSDDDLNKYLDYYKHAISYKLFVKNPHALHSKNKYDLTFKDNVFTYLEKTQNEIVELEKKFK